MHLWIVLTSLAAISHLTVSLKDSQKCRFDRVHKMVAQNCANLKLTAIPRNMKSSTEVRFACELFSYIWLCCTFLI